MKNNCIKIYESNVMAGKIGLRYNNYIPWLKVKDVKSCAVKSRIYSQRFGRMFHLLSHGEVMAFYQNLIAPGGDDQLAQKILSSAGTFQRTPGENGFDSRQLGADGFCGGCHWFTNPFRFVELGPV